MGRPDENYWFSCTSWDMVLKGMAFSRTADSVLQVEENCWFSCTSWDMVLKGIALTTTAIQFRKLG